MLFVLNTAEDEMNVPRSFQNHSNILMMHGALQPAVLCLKKLILSCTREEYDIVAAQLKSLLNYCTRISFIEVGPLLRCKEAMVRGEIEVSIKTCMYV